MANQRFGLGVLFSFVARVRIRAFSFPRAQLHKHKKVSLKSEGMSNAQRRKGASGSAGRAQDTGSDTHARASSSRQIACGHRLTGRACVAVEKVLQMIQGKR